MSSNDSMAQAIIALNNNVVLSWALQGMAIGGIVLGSRAALKRWMAVSTLVLPPAPETPVKQPEPPAKGWRRVISEKHLAGICGGLMSASIQLFVVFIMPNYTSTTFQNVFWSLLLFAGFSMFFDGAIRAALPVPTSVQFFRSDAPRKVVMKHAYIRQYPHRIALACLSALALIGATSQGVRILAPLGAGVAVATLVGGFSPPRLCMRWVIMGLNGYILGIPLLSLLIGAIVALCTLLFGSSDSTPTPPEPNTKAYPSEWVGEMMYIFATTLPTLFPGILCGMALRFDYSRARGPIVSAGPGEAVQVPTSLPSFAKPIFNTAIIALITTIAGLKAAAMMFPAFGVGGFDIVYVVATLPVVSLAMALRARSLGQARDWWMYDEQWIPKVEEDKAVVKGDVEANAAGGGEGEKDRLLTVEKGEKEEAED